MPTMQKELRNLKEHIREFMGQWPKVTCHIEPKQRDLEVILIAPNGRDRTIRVSGVENNPNRAKKHAERDVKRALESLNIAIPGEPKAMRPSHQQRVIHDFRDLVVENAKGLADEIDTTPREESKPMTNGHSNGTSHQPISGKPPVPPETIARAQQMRNDGARVVAIAAQLGIGESTIYQHTTPPPAKVVGVGASEGALAAAGRKERHQLTHAEVFKLGGLLMAHCACAIDTGFATYSEGWSDERIASEVSERCTADDVKKARMQHVGKTEAETPKTLTPETPFERQLLKLVNNLTTRIDSLEGMLEALTSPGK